MTMSSFLKLPEYPIHQHRGHTQEYHPHLEQQGQECRPMDMRPVDPQARAGIFFGIEMQW
jgi:hypothetical protein